MGGNCSRQDVIGLPRETSVSKLYWTRPIHSHRSRTQACPDKRARPRARANQVDTEQEGAACSGFGQSKKGSGQTEIAVSSVSLVHIPTLSLVGALMSGFQS